MNKTSIAVVVISLAVAIVAIFLYKNMDSNEKYANSAYNEKEKSAEEKKETMSSVVDNGHAGNGKIEQQKSLLSIAKNIKDSIPKELPKSMDDIVMTPELQKYLDEWPHGYEKLDYRLRLFDLLSQCIGDKEPSTGEIMLHFLFEIDHVNMVAIGSDGNGVEYPEMAFRIKKTTLDKEPQELILSCLREAHTSLTMDVSRMIADNEINVEQRGYYHPITIKFPLKDDDLYWVLENPGKPRP